MKTVIIHGKRIDRAPFTGRPDADLFGVTGCNVRYWQGKLKFSAWFDLHDPSHWSDESLEWMKAQERPIYLRDVHPDIPTSERYPIEAIQTRFPDAPFGCTDDYLIAFAITAGYDHIVLNGIGTTDDPLFQYLHRSLWYWIGFARGLGVTVEIDDPSCYCPRLRYGYDRLGYEEMEAFARAWEKGRPDRAIQPLRDLIQRLATTSTMNPVCAEQMIVSLESHFKSEYTR